MSYWRNAVFGQGYLSAISKTLMTKIIKEKEKQDEKGNIYGDNDDAYCIPWFW